MLTAKPQSHPPTDPFQELVRIFAKGYHRLSQTPEWQVKKANMQVCDPQLKSIQRTAKKTANAAQN